MFYKVNIRFFGARLSRTQIKTLRSNALWLMMVSKYYLLKHVVHASTTHRELRWRLCEDETETGYDGNKMLFHNFGSVE